MEGKVDRSLYLNKFRMNPMRLKISYTVFALMIGTMANAGVKILDGTYQLRNIFVMNGETEDVVGFCTTEVRVNGDITSDEINSSAYEIDLSQYGLKMGDKVEVQIVYRDGCDPTILNPGALKPATTFEISSITIDEMGLIKWSTINEQGTLPFVVQQFKWNKWVQVGQVDGEGTSNQNDYQFQTGTISGLNKFRVIQKNFEGKIRKSQEVSFTSNLTPVTFKYNKKGQSIEFSGKTSFEIFNLQGQIVKRGYDSAVDLSGLRKNTYYVAFDNDFSEFVKK